MSPGALVGGSKRLFTPVAVAFLLYFCWETRDTLAALLREASVPMLSIAGLIWASLHLLTPLLAVTVLSRGDIRIGWRQAFATHTSRLPARYVPGGVWHTVGRVMDYRQQGVDSRRLTAFVLLENGLAVAFTLVVGGAIVFASRCGGDVVGSLAGIASIVALLCLPALFYAVNRKVLRTPDAISARAYLLSLLITAAFWLGATAAFTTYLHVFPTATGGQSIVEVGGIYLFSWGIGFLAVFAPQGIGVFEVVAGELMHGPLGLAGLAALLAGFRVVIGMADLVVWSLYRIARQARP